MAELTKEQALSNIDVILKDKSACNISYQVGATILASMEILQRSLKELDELKQKEQD